MRNVLPIVRLLRAVATRLRNACVASLSLTLTLMLVAACSSTPSSNAATYTVKRGDTLYAIAYRHGLDYRDVARWNEIGRDFTIHPGQVLRLTAAGRAPTPSRPAGQAPKPPAPTPIAIPWRWPVDGGVAKLTQRPNGGHGLTITGRVGQEIRAASSGRVVYLGTGLLGYGQLLIIKHNDAYLSAYGHTQSVAVKEGDAVALGQRIATMGADSQGTPMLYFEIRSNGTPGNPLLLLPKR